MGGAHLESLQWFLIYVEELPDVGEISETLSYYWVP
jgi:hypothetical protein